MADSTVTIGADISDPRELAKLPNLSTEAAQKTLIQVEKAVQKAEKAAKASSKRIVDAQRGAARSITAANVGAAKALKGTSQGLQSVALQIPDVLSGLQAGQRASTIFVQQGLQVIQVNMATTIAALKALSGLLMGPFGVALGAAGAAAVVMANKLDEASEGLDKYKRVASDAEAETRSLAQSQNALRLAAGDVAGFVANLQIQTALLHGEIGSADLQAGALGGTLADTLRPALLAAGQAVAENAARIATLREAQASGRLGMADLATTAKELDEALGAQDGLEANLRNIKLLKGEGLDAINTYAQAIRDKDDAETPNVKTVDDLAKAEERLLAALAGVGEELGTMAEASRRLTDERRGLEDLDALAPGDLVAPTTIDRVRELTAAVDKLVPPAGLSKVDALTQLLFQLGAESDAAGGKNLILVDALQRVQDEIDALNSDPAGTGFFDRLGEAAQAAASRVRQSMAAVSGVVSGAIGLFDKFLQLAGGFSLSDLATVAAEGTITRDVLDAEGNVTGTETVGPGQVVDEMIKGGVKVVATFVDSIPQVVNALIGNLPRMFRAVQKAIPELFDTAIDALPRFIDAVVKRAPKLVQAVIAEIPALVKAVLDELPSLIMELGEGIGDILEDVVAAIPEIVADIVAALPAIATAISLALPSIVTKLGVALLKLPALLTEELINEAIAAVGVVVDEIRNIADVGIVPYFRDLLAKIGPLLKAWFADLFGLPTGDGKTASFGDTPGAVTAGLSGLAARFAPGDTVVAAQDPQEVLRQAEQAAGGSSNAREVRAVLDLRDGHLAFDRMFRTNIRAGGSLTSLNQNAVGRRKIYG